MAPGGNSDVTLRARLTLFFVAIVVLPMVAATVLLQALIGSEIERRSDDRLSLASRTAAAIFQERLQVAGRETRHVAKGLVDGIGDAALHEKITRAREEANLDFLVLTTDGAVVASSVGEAAYLEGVRAPTPAEVAGARGSAAVLRARVDVLSGNRTATVTGGFYADQELVRALARATRTDITLVSKGRPVASTLLPPPDLPSSGEGVIALEGGREALVTPLQGQDGGIAVVTRPEGVAGFETSLWLVVLGRRPAADAGGARGRQTRRGHTSNRSHLTAPSDRPAATKRWATSSTTAGTDASPAAAITELQLLTYAPRYW